MSLKPAQFTQIPELTEAVAKAAFPKGNVYMDFRDKFGFPFQDQEFSHLYSGEGQHAFSPARLAFLCIVQFREGLTDRQVADAARGRIDLKYVLALPLDDKGFEFPLLSKFRKRLLQNHEAALPFNNLLTLFQQEGLLKGGGQQRTDSTHIFGAIRILNRLECVGQALHHALNTLTDVIPEWLQQYVPAEWFERYGRSFESYQLPKPETQRQQLAQQIGEDGHQLLQWLEDIEQLQLLSLPALEALRQIWIQQYYHQDGVLVWREHSQLPPPSKQIRSPYEVEVRRATKRKMNWTGYKMHLTETCNEQPHLVVNVELSQATDSDMDALEPIHQNLQHKKLLPDEHQVDVGYSSAANIIESEKKYGVSLISSVMPDTSWQAKEEGGISLEQFELDWENREATCPQGKKSVRWREEKGNDGETLNFKISFSAKDCQVCESRLLCTKSREGRTLKVRKQEEHEKLQERRIEQQTDEFKEKKKKRAGVEGSISQIAWGHEMRQARYQGKAKVLLQAFFTATAINLTRVANWLRGIPQSSTKASRFASLNPCLQ